MQILKMGYTENYYLIFLATASLPVHVEIIGEEKRRKSSEEEPLPEVPSGQTFKSSAQGLKMPDSPEQQQSELPLPGTSKSSPNVLTLPELQKQESELSISGTSRSSDVLTLAESEDLLHDLGKTEENSAFRDKQSNEGLHSEKGKFIKSFMELITNSMEKIKISKSNEERNEEMKFMKTLAETGIKIKSVIEGSIILVLEFSSLAALLCFGALYNSGMFKNMLQDGFITQDYLASRGLSSATLSVEVKKEDYKKCLETMTQGKHYNTCLLTDL